MTAPAALSVFHDARMAGHDPGHGHPESPARLDAAVGALSAARGLGLAWRQPAPAPREALARVHSEAYLDRLDAIAGCPTRLDPDTATSEASDVAARLAAGGALAAVDLVMGAGGDSAGDRMARRAMVLARPPGHHAETGRAMGFCLLNNVAIAAAHALDAHGLGRVMVIDWDVHHGNGTQHRFEERADVLVANTHAWPLYPGSGAAEERGRGEGLGHTVNVPLAPGATDGDVALAFEDVILPIAERYRPELVLVSAGFDAHVRDPVGPHRMSTDGFAHLCARVRALADRVADGRLVLCLEGGYDLAALGASVVACARVLAGDEGPETPHAATARGRQAVAVAREVHAEGWALG